MNAVGEGVTQSRNARRQARYRMRNAALLTFYAGVIHSMGVTPFIAADIAARALRTDREGTIRRCAERYGWNYEAACWGSSTAWDKTRGD